MSHLSELLRRLRIDNDLPLSEVAEVLGVSRQAVSKIEMGHMKCPLSLVPKFAHVFKIKLNILVKALCFDFEEECREAFKEADSYPSP